MRFACGSLVVAFVILPTDSFARPPQPVYTTTLRMSATAYCQHGRTKSGVYTRDGIVAADPRRLSMGTRIQILTSDKSYAGVYTVTDTGAKVKGRKLDIFMPSCSKARRFGRRVVDVKVLRERERR